MWRPRNDRQLRFYTALPLEKFSKPAGKRLHTRFCGGDDMSLSEHIAAIVNALGREDSQKIYMQHKRALDALAQAIDFECMLAYSQMQQIAQEISGEKH